MGSTEYDAAREEPTIEQAVRACGATQLLPVARAIFERAGDAATARGGRAPAVAASVCVAVRRAGRRDLDVESAALAVGATPAATERAVEAVERVLSPPGSPAEVRALRRTIVALREILSAIENGRRNPPRIPPSTLAEADPGLARLALGTLEDVDADALCAHLSRLEADLEMARLGVELHELLERRNETARPTLERPDRS